MSIRSNISPRPEHLKLIEFDQDEQALAEIVKHPIGLLPTYFFSALIVSITLVAAVVAIVLLRDQDFLPGWINWLIVGLAVFITAAGVFGAALGAYIYRNNVLIVTNEKIAQVLYTSFFDRKVSQVGLGQINDVSVSQKGIIGRLFNLGELTIETEGEQNNFIFPYVPNAPEIARTLVGAHEEYIKRYGN